MTNSAAKPKVALRAPKNMVARTLLESDNKNLFADMVHDLRLLGWTYEELADELQCTKPHIANLQRGSIPNWYLGERIRQLHQKRTRVYRSAQAQGSAARPGIDNRS